MFATAITVYVTSKYDASFSGVGPVIVDVVAWLVIAFVGYHAFA